MSRASIAFLLLLCGVSARADWSQPAVGIDCFRDRDTMTIRYFSVSNGYAFDSNTYDPWSLVQISDSPEKTIIIGTSHRDHYCRFRSVTIRVRIEPEVFNGNVLGRCGAAISAAVTVFRGNRRILNRYAFQTDCHDPKEPVAEIRVDARTGHIQMLHDELPELLNAH